MFCVCSQFNDLGGRWDITVQALARWQHPVASSEALDMLHQVMCPALLSWKCRFFRCRPQLILTTWCRVFPTRRPDTADVSATSCDVGFFFSVSYVVSLPNCRHVVVVCSLITYTINHSRYPELHKRFSTLQLLLSCSPFCHVLSGATQKMHERTTQNTTTQHTTINMSNSRPTLQRLCPLSLHG